VDGFGNTGFIRVQIARAHASEPVVDSGRRAYVAGPDATLFGAYQASRFHIRSFRSPLLCDPPRPDGRRQNAREIVGHRCQRRELPLSICGIEGAFRTEQNRRGGITTLRRVSLDPDSASTDRDNIHPETEGLRKLIADSLAATETYRGELNRQGCVCVISPPLLNTRLATQQGTFLLNLAQGLSFNVSLVKMMSSRVDWCRILDISVDAIPEIESRLFQMNVHQQSLFPDIEGLAGLIRQKSRLFWR
jgi:hypothetical protein